MNRGCITWLHPRHAVLLLVAISTALRMVNGLSDREQVLYTDITPLNTTQCLDVINRVPLRQYVFKYDRSGRGPQVGVIGEEVQALLPQAVDIVATRSFPNPEKGQPPIVVKDLAVIDKNVLFMTNIGAVQRLMERHAETNERLSKLYTSIKEQDQALEDIKKHVANLKEQEGREILRLAEMEVERTRRVLELEKVALEEEARTVEEQARQEREYGDFLESQEQSKSARQNELEKARTLETLQAREAIAKEREDAKLRRELELKEKELAQLSELEMLKREGEVARIKAEAQAKEQAERRMEEVNLRAIKVKAEEDRKRAMEIINLVVEKLGGVVRALVDEPKRLAFLSLLFLILVTCYYTVRETLSLVRHMIESQIGKPRLVRETSRSSGVSSFLRRLLLLPRGLWRRRADRDEVVGFFKDVVLPTDLREQVHLLAVSTRNAKANGAPYRHLLLHGPPGTGKTMVAKRLASSSGMDYAVMSGGDVGPLGKDAVTELHRLFHWAQQSSRGLLLFIDEAEAFLSARGAVDMSEGRRNALNALLYQTGQQSYNFMMVLATNRPQDLDSAVLDRMDDYLSFPLPSMTERTSLLRLYYDTYLIKRLVGNHGCLAETDFARVSKTLEGFSGREISKLMLSLVNAVYGSAGTKMSKELFEGVVAQKRQEHKQKAELGFASLGDATYGDKKL